MNFTKTISAIAMLAAASWATPTLNEITGWHLKKDISASSAESAVLTDVDGVNDDATAFLMFEIAGLASQNTFGIYGFTTNADGSITLGNSLELFAGIDGPITSSTIEWNASHTMATNLGTGDSAAIGTEFGFYIARADGFVAYSHSSLNGGADMALIFDTVNNGYGALLGSDIIVAFEDLPANVSDWDYNDLVVGISDVRPVPEPATIGLMGLGLFAVGFLARRRKTA